MIQYRHLNKSELTYIEPLWEELNRVHLDDSIYFKEHYKNFTFGKRIAVWEKLPEENIHILVAISDSLVPIAYCVSTVDENRKAEIDSLFVSSAFRKLGIGKTLVEKSLEWLQSVQCVSIRLTVSYGHESVFAFYQHLGFFPRLTVLEWKKQG